MRPLTILGFLLILAGLVTFVVPRITYTKRERILDAGPIHASADKKESIPLSPALGALMFTGGIVVLIVGRRSA